MPSYRAQILSKELQEAVFDYISDFTNCPDWDPGVSSARRNGEGPIKVGDSFELLVSLGGRTRELAYEVVEIEAPRRMVLRCEAPGFTAVDTIQVRGSDIGTLVDYTAEIHLAGARVVLAPVVQRLLRRAGDRAAEGLREVIT